MFTTKVNTENQILQSKNPHHSIVKQQKKEKPKWAITDEDFDGILEEEETKDVEDLLEFTKSLDFEEYIDDFEINTALNVIKNRVEEIETKKDVDSSTHQATAEEKEKKKKNDPKNKEKLMKLNKEHIKKTKPKSKEQSIQIKKVNHPQEWNRSTKLGKEKKKRKENISKIKNIKKKMKVHSKKSIQTIIERIEKGKPTKKIVSKKVKKNDDVESNVRKYIESAEEYQNDTKIKEKPQRHLIAMKKNTNNPKNLNHLYRCDQI